MFGRQASFRLQAAIGLGLVAVLALLPFTPGAASSAADSRIVKFKLKANQDDPNIIEVLLNFRLKQGENISIMQNKESNQSSTAESPTRAEPVVELVTRDRPECQIEVLPKPDVGWAVKAMASGGVSVQYRVRMPVMNRPQSAVEARSGANPSTPIMDKDLKVFRGSEVLFCPVRPGNGLFLTNNYLVDIEPAAGEKILVPWKSADGGKTFKVEGTENLLDNFVTWGRIDTQITKSTGPKIEVGFTGDYGRLSAAEKSAYARNLLSLFGRIRGTMGPRKDLGQLSVLVSYARGGQKETMALAEKDSMVMFHAGRSLSGPSAAAAGRGLFELWIQWGMPKGKEGVAWFREGSPWFYSYRLASEAGLLDSDRAYVEFSHVYADYITNPAAGTTSLAEAEQNRRVPLLIRDKGAVVCALIDQRLIDMTNGGKDFEWLLGEIAKKAGHSGGNYGMTDIEELLEDATSKSWNRFFAQRVNGTGLIVSSEFSKTDLFSSVPGGGGTLEGKSSGKNWWLLLVAILVIFMIPIIFSTYVRRSVKLDVSMPRILPEDDEEEE